MDHELYKKHHFLWVDYTNYKAERSWRRVIPLSIECGVMPHHGDEPQWFMHVLMEDRGFAPRTLAIKDIHNMKQGGPSPMSWGRNVAEKEDRPND